MISRSDFILSADTKKTTHFARGRPFSKYSLWGQMPSVASAMGVVDGKFWQWYPNEHDIKFTPQNQSLVLSFGGTQPPKATSTPRVVDDSLNLNDALWHHPKIIHQNQSFVSNRFRVVIWQIDG